MNTFGYPISVLTSVLGLALCIPLAAQDGPAEKRDEPRLEKKDPYAGKKPSKEREEMMAQMKREIEELSRAGHHEKAEHLKHKLAQVYSESGEPKKKQAEGMERLRHVKEAIGHLHAAGLNEPAKHLEQALAEMSIEFERDRREFEQHKKGAGKEAGGSPELRRELEEVRAQMHRMAQEMQELRAQLKKQQ